MSLSRSSYTFFKYKITEKHDLSKFKINNLEIGDRKHPTANWSLKYNQEKGCKQDL